MGTLTAFERLEPREDERIEDMIGILRRALERAHQVGATLRDAHPRTLAVLRGEFEVRADLPDELRVGVFAEPRTFQAWFRVSSADPKPRPDRVKDQRGFAIKLLAVDGPHVEEADEPSTQDFVLISMPTTPSGTVELFHEVVKGTNEGPVVVFLLRSLLTGKGSMLRTFQAAKTTPSSPLDIRYWSTVPFLFGADRVVKYGLVPTSARTSPTPPTLTDTYLVDAMRNHLSNGEATFDFAVQFQRDPAKMPVEDAGVEWLEADSPFVPLATVRIPMQEFSTRERLELGEQLSFSPAHALVEHRPIGGLNRARMRVYRALSDFRHERDGRSGAELDPA